MSERVVLRVEEQAGTWKLVGPGAERFVLVNDYLGYLVDRNYSARTVRAYALDLLQFARWLEGEGLGLAEVTTEVMLGFLAACRAAVLPGRPGGNVFSIRDGRNAGYAPATINRRLAAVSGLFAFWGLRDPAAPNPVPRGREARGAARGQRTGLLAHVAKPKPRSRLRVREPRRLPRGLDRVETQALLASFRTWRDRAMAGLMLLSGLRSAEVLGLAVQDVDVGRRWVRVVGKGDRERRVPVDPEVVGAIQAYLLAERPVTDATRLFVVAKGPTRGQPLTSAGLRTVFRYHRWRAGVPAGHPHALRHSFGTALAEAGVDLAVIQALMGTTMWTRPPPTSTWPPLTCEPSLMLPTPACAPGPEPDLLGAYAAYLAATGRSGRLALAAAERFLARWPDPQAWAAEPLEVRLGAGQTVRPLLTFLMLQGHLRPGYDYLVARKLPTLWRELPHSPLAADLDRFAATAALLGFSQRVRSGIGSQVIARLLIQTGRPLDRLTQADFDELAAACVQRTARTGKGWRHYSSALHAGRQVLYHLGVLVEPPVNPNRRLRQSFQRRMAGVPDALRTCWWPTWNG
jgi:site-specific recombinase XerD